MNCGGVLAFDAKRLRTFLLKTERIQTRFYETSRIRSDRDGYALVTVDTVDQDSGSKKNVTEDSLRSRAYPRRLDADAEMREQRR